MSVSRAEKNRRKRERKKRQKEEERNRQEIEAGTSTIHQEDKNEEEIEIEIEYVPDDVQVQILDSLTSANDDTGSENNLSEVLRRFNARSSILISDDEMKNSEEGGGDEDVYEDYGDGDGDDEANTLSKKKKRKLNRLTVAELKNRVDRADLVEAHDITSADPELLLFLKSLPGTVPVPRHWGRKRKYLQGKRGIEKAPFQLPDFIVRTGISEVRSAVDEDEDKQSIKKKNRGRVAPKMGALDVDYRTLHDAFFKHQNKASIQEKLTKIGDLYYEGKEFETQKSNDLKVGKLSQKLRDALGMTADNSPVPWLINMQRFGPPPSYPSLSIPGLNAPIPEGCTYGYHLNGWGKPPIDAFGRPLYGGNPFDVPGTNASSSNWEMDSATGAIITSDGKTVAKTLWGCLPTAGIDLEDDEENESSEESSSEDDDSSSAEEMAESDEEGEVEEESKDQSSIANEVSLSNPSATLALRKQAGDETPAPAQQLYKVIQQTDTEREKQPGAVFASEKTYIVTGSALKVPEGAESVLSKAPIDNSSKRKRDSDFVNDDEDLGKKFKF